MSTSDTNPEEGVDSYLRAQNGFPHNSVKCRAGDNVDVNTLDSIFRIVTNNVYGLRTANEGG
eukprot:6000975-Ditylum_brightwellii.AAC.1